MLKGKTKRQKRYISIMFVPLYSSKIRTFKISSFYIKLSSILLITTMLLATLAIYINKVAIENKKLREDVAFLYKLNFEQNDLLVQQNEILDVKKEAIAQLNSKIEKQDVYIKDKLDDILGKYQVLTDTYVLNRIGSTTSRSGDRVDVSISDGIGELKNILNDLNDMNRYRSSYPIDVSESTKRINDYLSALPTMWPAAGSISSYFGSRSDPITGIRKSHEGLDIGGDYGSNIVAAGSGVVTFSGYNAGYGYCVIIDHGHGISTLYAHASSLLVNQGDTVDKGSVIAKIGSTGRSTGPHLHFEVRVNENKVNPLEFLELDD